MILIFRFCYNFGVFFEAFTHRAYIHHHLAPGGMEYKSLGGNAAGQVAKKAEFKYWNTPLALHQEVESFRPLYEYDR
jgi:hypothetical protein